MKGKPWKMPIALAMIFAGLTTAQAAEAPSVTPLSGPAVESFGEYYPVEDAVEVGNREKGVRAVFDVAIGSEDPAEVNKRIDTVARFLNMHLASGFPRDRVEAVLVLHGTAARDSLDDAAYRKRFGVPNPNLPLLESLADVGVGVYLCGQSAAFRGFGRDEIAAPVEVALSAMTVLLQKQAEGFGMIAF